ncbi:hypothetical protein BSL78_27119 [Apostichopus japonicus]|uniref:ZAD domain-containing protein n=1 Tax=Stichopus japonicus TaxID=307972 RepID=A0A2G8JJX9_STIJA|nr:hypothetical protein BSL78_27119 [Apostichopus japonicus]
MDLHRALLSCICRLCGTRGHEIAASKLTPKCNLSRDIYSSLDIDINEDSQDIHPPSICDTCRLKVSRWKKNKYNRKKDLQPPNITIHEFSAHDDACQVCAERQWDAKIVADFLQQQGMFSWNEEGEVVGVVVDRGGNGILKKVSVKGQNIDCFVLGKRVEIPFKSMEDVATKFLDASICPGNGDFQELAHTNLYCGLKSQSGSSIATVEKGFYDGRTLQSKYIIRHANCQLILPQSVATASNRSFTLCKACLLYRSTLQRAQEGQKQRNETKAKFVPTKFLSPDELREKVGQLHQEKTSVLQQNRRLKERIEQSLKEDSVEIIEAKLRS